MDQTTEGLKRDIETNRAAMTDTLEAIGDRVSPGRVIERRRNRMVVWVRDAKDRLMGTAEDLSDRVSDKAHQLGDAPHSRHRQRPVRYRAARRSSPAASRSASGCSWAPSYRRPAPNGASGNRPAKPSNRCKESSGRWAARWPITCASRCRMPSKP